MSRILKQIFLQRRHTDAQQAHEKILNIANYEKSNLQWGITSYQLEWLSLKSLQTINAGEGVEKKEPSYSIGGNVNWHNHYGEQYGDSLKNLKIQLKIWSSNSTLGHTPGENHYPKEYMYPDVHCRTIYNNQDMEAMGGDMSIYFVMIYRALMFMLCAIFCVCYIHQLGS